MPYISQGKASKILGISQPTISQHIKKGRLTRPAINEQNQVDTDLAKAQLKKTLNPNRGGDMSKRHEKPRAVDDGSKYAHARAMRETYAAQLLALELQEKTGEMIRKTEAYDALFVVARETRDSLSKVHTRIRSIVAHQKDEHICGEIIDAEIRAALESMESKVKEYAGKM